MDPYKEAILLLDKRRQFYENEKMVRTKEIYDKFPKIKAIDDDMSALAMQIAKQTLLGDTSGITTLKTKMDTLIADKELLLGVNNYPADYLKLHFHCDICEDTGFVNVNQSRCNCFKKIVVDKLYERSNLKDVLDRENFDHFDIRYFSDVKDPKTGLSPRDNIHVIYKEALQFVDHFSVSHTSLLFYGDPGLGKTFLCHCIAKDILDKNIPVLYTTSSRLTKTIESSRFDKDPTSNDILDMYYSSPLLIIDDLGTEFSTIISQAEIFNIINTRLFEKKSTIISTNLNFKDLEDKYSGRIVSRLIGEYKHFRFVGDDIRIQKKRKLAGLWKEKEKDRGRCPHP